MTRQKIQIKKIDNIAARQVTFSKRKRPFQESSRAFHSLRRRDSSFSVFKHRQALRLQSRKCAMLSKEIAEKTRELRRLRGEELQGLDLEELKELEKLLEGGLNRVTQTKDERFFKEINTLKMKGVELMEENQQLKEKMENSPHVAEQGQPSETAGHAWRSFSSDISLRLGLPYPN
ncbi:MIKC mads-box transcription factor, putative isoform 2 [Hibiscus syriacus]|uniref:MIKC mads-box transcription factor, putative isoform 2 n=1 Tax=Hibiscus syriacus TaxID=106335 RepID=A0A6A2Z832_HIBSY|nr:MIKC mads-box transcription factor, putative isoform 2 [Hibiscus syriacus]